MESNELYMDRSPVATAVTLLFDFDFFFLSPLSPFRFLSCCFSLFDN